MVDDEEEDTLTYHYKNTYKFRPDLSGPGLTGDETVVMIHPCKCRNKTDSKFGIYNIFFHIQFSDRWNVDGNQL